MYRFLFVIQFVIIGLMFYIAASPSPNDTTQTTYDNSPMIIDQYDYREMYRASIIYDMMYGY